MLVAANYVSRIAESTNDHYSFPVRNLESAIAVPIHESPSRRSDACREARRIGTLPICTEKVPLSRSNGYDAAAIVATFLQIDAHFAAGSLFSPAFANADLAGFKEL